ncbi:DUF4913 domain-containing protein [Nocardia sp. 2]|uniref:DUF4913 domain-containing protein n=2 Tax=Nocardia acididurans TaxID=2802282 RepID=A0ABS1M8T3_9NOCA|nr:DUF4913 domain-containing protein [Nocardia acididurans]
MVYGSVVEFVENYLSLVYRRDVTDHARRVWCPEWWKHAEAVARLDCLWRAWESLRTDSRTGLSIWFLDHADPHMAELFHSDGPFKFCSISKGHRDSLPPLPVKSPLKGLFSEPFV